MSEYNKVQLSFTTNGDHVVFRADTGEELLEVAKSVAENYKETLDAVNTVKQVGVASGVFTGDSLKKNGGDNKKSRSSDTPPPSGGEVEVPTCEHGPMKDLRGNGYKYDFYCPSDEKDWKKKCKPVKL